MVIGRRGRRIHRDRALDHVAGCLPCSSLMRRYAIFNCAHAAWTMGKNFGTTGSIRSLARDTDAVPPGAQGLRIQGRLNGRVMQESRTDRLIFSVPMLIEVISVAITLEPGDLIITGTPGGVGSGAAGCLHAAGRCLRSGDPRGLVS